MQLTGDLSKVSLPNLLNLVRNGELTGKIAMLQGAKTATLYVERGEVIHTELDMMLGREALMELFLWLSGSFSFFEEDTGAVPRSLFPGKNHEDTLERLVRDGLSYLEQKKYLDQLHISGQTVLSPIEAAFQPQSWSSAERQMIYPFVEPILMRIDGRKPLSEALADANLTRRSYVIGVYNLVIEGLAVVTEPEPDVDEAGERVNLPPWVVTRLKQDNADLSQAIVDMVIWVDRVKCWMYQVDADFTKILDEVTVRAENEAPEEDFFTQLSQGDIDYQGPLFGEAAIPSGSQTQKQSADTSPYTSNDSTNTPVRTGDASPNPAKKPLTGAEYYGRMTGPPPEEQPPSPATAKKLPPSIEF